MADERKDSPLVLQLASRLYALMSVSPLTREEVLRAQELALAQYNELPRLEARPVPGR